MNDQMLIYVCTFGAVVLLGYFVTQLLAKPEQKQLRDRLSTSGAPKAATRQQGQGFLPLLQRIGQAAAEPFMPKTREKQSGLRHSLARAGIYSPSAVRLVTGCKVIFLVAGLVAGYVFGLAWDLVLLGVSIGGVAGFLPPTPWVRPPGPTNPRHPHHRPSPP